MSKFLSSLVLLLTWCSTAPVTAVSLNYKESESFKQQSDMDWSPSFGYHNYLAGYYGGGYHGGRGYYGGGGYYGGRGYPWYPVTGYWAGGFWGPFAVGAITGAITGAIVTAASQPQYYTVQSGAPGFTLLTNYGLTQIRCGGTGLVVINGPSGSVICALPTLTVPAGTYLVEPSNLTLIPRY